MIFVELAILLICIVIGARVGGIGLGTVAGSGLALLVFVFGLPPGVPPRTVLGMILCVITATASMKAAGGLDDLVTIAEGALRAKPKAITFVAPIVVYLFVFLAGTAHVTYALLPVIASPISAAMVALLGFVVPLGLGLKQILMITVPSTFIGCMLGALAVSRVGRELADNPEFQRRLAAGEIKETAATTTKLEGAALT